MEYLKMKVLSHIYEIIPEQVRKRNPKNISACLTDITYHQYPTLVSSKYEYILIIDIDLLKALDTQYKNHCLPFIEATVIWTANSLRELLYRMKVYRHIIKEYDELHISSGLVRRFPTPDTRTVYTYLDNASSYYAVEISAKDMALLSYDYVTLEIILDYDGTS